LHYIPYKELNVGHNFKIKAKSLFKFSSYSHPEIWKFQGVTNLPPLKGISSSRFGRTKKDFENDRVELMWGSVDREHTKHGPCIYVVQPTTRGVWLSLGDLRGLVSIPHLPTLHWGILDAPVGTIVSIVTNLSTLKACITNMSTWRTRSH
jgi:hypothetical protein